MESLGTAIIGFLSMGILAGVASAVYWALKKWRPQTSWKTAVLVTILILFLVGPLIALIQGTPFVRPN